MRYGTPIATLVLSVILWRGKRLLQNNILFTPALPQAYYAHGNASEQCVAPQVDGLQYCEDAVFWDVHAHPEGPVTQRRVLVTCDAGRKAWNTVMGPMHDPAPKGSLWVIMGEGEAGWAGAVPVRLTLDGYPPEHDFHPLGLDISPSINGGASTLFVVNHARDRTCVEQFSVSPAAPTVATHVRTLDSPHFISANSLALTSPASFFVTNDHRFTRRLPFPLNHVLPIAESVLSLPLGWAAHVRVDEAHDKVEQAQGRLDGYHRIGRLESAAVAAHPIAAPNIPFPNGIALSPARDTVAISSTTSAEIWLYKVAGSSATETAFTGPGESPDSTASDQYTAFDSSSAAPLDKSLAFDNLIFEDRIPLPFLPDNIAYTDDGSLIVAGHPNFPNLAALAGGGTTPAGSWVVRVARRASNESATPVESASFAESATPVDSAGRVESAVPTDSDNAPVDANHYTPPHSRFIITTLYQSDGSHFQSSTTGLYDARTGGLIITGLYADPGVLLCAPLSR